MEDLNTQARMAHERGLQDNTLNDYEALMELLFARDNYELPLDQARAGRDVGRKKHAMGDGSWTLDVGESIEMLQDLHDADPTDARVLREMGASACMYGRLDFAEQLQSRGEVETSGSVPMMREGLQQIKQATKGIRPDQYRINFEAIAAMTEAYAGNRWRALLGAGRSAVLACISESPWFTAEVNPNYTMQEKLKKRAGAMGRAAFAGAAAIVPPGMRQTHWFRSIGSKTLS